MELYTAEARLIQKCVADWLAAPTFELEATFGKEDIKSATPDPTRTVDATTFLAVAQRLRAKGYTSLPQEDRLTITTPEHYRFTLSGLGIIQQYCRDDILAGKPFEAIVKDRATAESQVDLEDYDTRVKLRRELPLTAEDSKVKAMFASWGQQQKAFRMIRRWSFAGDGLRFDLSIVRSTRKGAKGEYRWQRRFRDQDVLMSPPTYEIEVELLRKEEDAGTGNGASDPAAPMKRLIKGMGEVLRGIQKHHLLIRSSSKRKVLAAYAELTGTEQFRGPTQRVMMKKNFMPERVADEGNVRDGYNVTDKADGLRALGFCDSRGELFLIDMGLNVYRSGLQRPECRLSLVDGEWLTLNKAGKPIQHYKIFDIFYAPDKKDVSQLPFQPPAADKPLEGRHGQMLAWVAAWNKEGGAAVVSAGLTPITRLQVSAKDFIFARAGDTSIFVRGAARILDTARDYYTDGLIFTPNKEPLPAGPMADFAHQFKWKPSHDNTVDFLVTTEKVVGSKSEDLVETGVKPDTGATVTYKTLNLMVGSALDDPRDIILNQKEIPSQRGPPRRGGKEYRPVRFTPSEFPDPMASICYVEIQEDPDTGEQYCMTENTKEPIQDKTIVEMAYDPLQPPGWRWKPLRVRMDKTERLQRGVIARTLNSEKVATETWESIYDPITESMIRSGNAAPSEVERERMALTKSSGESYARKYYDKRKDDAADQRLVADMATFHNRVIKEDILFRVGLMPGAGTGAAAAAAAAGPKGSTAVVGRSLIDMACGRGGDIHKWRKFGANFVFGLDFSAPNINDKKGDSAYKRYLGLLSGAGVRQAGERSSVPPMVFAVANSAKNYRSGEAGSTSEEQDILRAVLGSGPVSKIPPYVENVVGGALRDGADCMSCMFALHYFFESPQMLSGFLRNIAENLKVGGLFVGCCFDGERVFEMLRGTEKGEAKVGKERDVQLWRITKQYDADSLPEGDEAIGLPIDVDFITIGKEHREYLVPYNLLVAKMAEIGLTPLKDEELAAVKLPESSATFDKVFAAVGGNFRLPEKAKEYSFLNRWFIFKKRSDVAPAAAPPAAGEAAASASPNLEAALAAHPENEGLLAGPYAKEIARLTSVQRQRLIERTMDETRGRPAIGGPGMIAFEQLAEVEPETAAELLHEVTGRRIAVPARPAAAQAGALSASRSSELAAALEASGAGGAPVLRTVPVAPGSAAAASRFYTEKEIFLFYDSAALKDSLGIKMKGAARWLALSAPFPIKDPDDTSIVYPTVEHFLAGMKYKLATDTPELGISKFSKTGSIHQEFTRKRMDISLGNGGRALTEDEDYRLLKEEADKVRSDSRDVVIRANKRSKFDPARWVAQKDAVLRAALTQRWNTDADLRKILEAAREKGKTLLYYQPGTATSNLGGVRRATGVLEGSNKVGQLYMELAGFPGFV